MLYRAFSPDLAEVDLGNDPPTIGATTPAIREEVRQRRLTAFTRERRFARLNTSLSPRHLRYGFRVFEEIMAFLDSADRNGLVADVEALASFDAAALTKVPPKFHGSRGKLGQPLRAKFAWSIDPVEPNDVAVANVLEGFDAAPDAATIRGRLPALRWPQTTIGGAASFAISRRNGGGAFATQTGD